MVKVRVHIFNGELFMDEDVFLELTLPWLPSKEDNFYLSDSSYKALEKQATKTLAIASVYKIWFMGHSSGLDFITKESFKDINFEDAHTVKCVSFNEGDQFVDIELYG